MLTGIKKEELINDPHFKLLSFLISSARGCVYEPQLYGPLRLVDAAARLMDVMENEGKVNDDLRRLRDLIREKMYLVMYDEEGFIRFLDDVSRELAKIIK